MSMYFVEIQSEKLAQLLDEYAEAFDEAERVSIDGSRISFEEYAILTSGPLTAMWPLR